MDTLGCGCMTDFDEAARPRWVRGPRCKLPHASLIDVHAEENRAYEEAISREGAKARRKVCSECKFGVCNSVYNGVECHSPFYAPDVYIRPFDHWCSSFSLRAFAASRDINSVSSGRIEEGVEPVLPMGSDVSKQASPQVSAPDFIGAYALPGLGQVQLAFKNFAVFIDAGEVDAVIAGLSEAAAILRGQHPAQTDVWTIAR